jgi:uncharacterized protein
MDDCNADVETMMQWLSKSPTARRINGQLDRLQHDLLTGAPLLQYLRYNVEYEHQWMARHLEIERPQSEFDLLAKMDRPESMRDLATLGQLAAARQIQEEHFPIEVI